MTSPALVWAPGHSTVQPKPSTGLWPGDRGPDVASYQGFPDWSSVVRAGYKFAFTKCTEGTDYLNPYYEQNWNEIARNGLLRGVYHFARPDSNTPERECDYFLSHLYRLEWNDMLVLDLEDGAGNLKNWALSWLKRCHDHTGKLPLLYTGPSFMYEHGLEDSEVAAASGGLWLAAYRDTPPPVPPGWSEIAFWQFTDSHKIQGIGGNVDCNIYRP